MCVPVYLPKATRVAMLRKAEALRAAFRVPDELPLPGVLSHISARVVVRDVRV